MKVSSRNSCYFEKGLVALTNPRNPGSRTAGWIDAVATARDQQCATFEFGLARNISNSQGVTTGAQREAMDERILSFHGNGCRGVGEKLKPMPTPIASQDSPHQSIGRNHRRVVRQDERPSSPDLHRARNEVSICATTDQGSGIELGIGSCKIADFTEGGKIRLEEYLSSTKCLKVDPHLAVFDHGTLKTASSETDVNGEVNSALGDHGYWFGESAQPRE